ncbi:unnamed protein product [Symbiodinium sp. CCMP2592]|nr:unnamed protein product [Symbiodinium sp. CCMP2592]
MNAATVAYTCQQREACQQPTPPEKLEKPAAAVPPETENKPRGHVTSHVEVLKSPTSATRGSKRPHPLTPTKPVKPVEEPSECPDDVDGDDDEEPPKVLNFHDLSKLEKEKVRRIVTPKRGSGNLEVPENIFEMWKDAGKGRDNLFRMWAKSGGVKAGGFYSKDDMRTELAYSASRIEKIVAWAEKKGLVRTCEYDDETLEYWVNTRTSGTMTKEDFEMMQRERQYQGEGGTELNVKQAVNLEGFSFSDDDDMVHSSNKGLEGDHHKSVASQVKEYMKSVLKAKNSLEGFVDKMKTAGSSDPKASTTVKKMDAVVKEYEAIYEEMSEIKAEGGTIGYSEKLSGCTIWGGSLLSRVRKAAKKEEVAASHLDGALVSETAVASKILWHCVKEINALRQKHGGNGLCVFKIGLTSDPVRRSQSYFDQNFQSFVVLHKVSRPELLGMLEMLVPAKDLVADAAAAVKTDPCKVLAQIAKIQLSNADAPLYELLQKHGLGLPIDFSWEQAGNAHRYPFIKPKALLEALSEQGYFHRVLGVPVHLACESLRLFWKKFREHHPQHQVFNHPGNLDYEKLIPYYLHGDGGRGYKKDSIEILSMFPALGTGSRERSVDLSSKRRAEVEPELGINLQGNSGATRFLFSVVSSLVAKTDGQIFDDVMDIWGRELHSLLEHGFHASGSTWRIVILGFTGDSPFVKKVAKTNRSFHNIRKRFSSTGKQIGCCWLCHAGHESPEDDVHIPFEHLGFVGPEWIQTCGLNNPLPWDGAGGPLLQYMLCDAGDTPAAFFKADFFHVWHAGTGQDFTASALVYSMKTLFGLGGVVRDLNELNGFLKSFLRQSKSRLHCGRLTQDLLGYSSTREYPEGKWSKNMDTATISKFIIHLLQLPQFQASVRGDDILQEILAAAKAMERVIKTCLKAEYFMSPADTEAVVESGYAFLMRYSALVRKCYDRSLSLFKLRPKIHYLNHVFLRTYQEWLSNGSAINPFAEATFMSEDFVGRAARVSRRVSPRAVAVKTLQRYIFLMKAALEKDAYAMLDMSMFA